MKLNNVLSNVKLKLKIRLDYFYYFEKHLKIK